MSANDVQIGGEHYKKLVVQPWDFFVSAGIWRDFFVCSSIAYLSRWKEKGGRLDLRKALHYTEKRIELGDAPVAYLPTKLAEKFYKQFGPRESAAMYSLAAGDFVSAMGIIESIITRDMKEHGELEE